VRTDPDPYERLDTACASLSDKLTEVADRIAVRPAQSWSGLVAKADVVKAAIDAETGLVNDIANPAGGSLPSANQTSMLQEPATRQ
jgi:hypothetical protein